MARFFLTTDILGALGSQWSKLQSIPGCDSPPLSVSFYYVQFNSLISHIISLGYISPPTADELSRCLEITRGRSGFAISLLIPFSSTRDTPGALGWHLTL